MDNKNKPFEMIAARFQVSQESAKYFLNHVQKSFRNERPSHRLIIDFLETQDFEYLPTPYETASRMKETGAWDFELGSPPPSTQDDPKEDIFRPES